jgi:hypothetical protein
MLTPDERLVVPARSVVSKERVFLRDLAQYLHHGQAALKRFAKKHRLLHLGPRRAGREAVAWVTPYGATRIIAYIRAIQGERYARGLDYHRECERSRAYDAQKRVRKKLAIAISRAGAEAEPSGAGQR